MKIAQITIETRKQPLGLDALSPRISWISQSDALGVNQQAYRVRVATDEQMTALVWDTGRVESDQSVLLPYAGKPLASRTALPCERAGLARQRRDCQRPDHL